MIAETCDTKGLFDKLRALPDGPVVPDRLVAVEKKVESLLSQTGDHSKHRATGDALAKTQKDVEALQNQIKKFLATIDSQSQKIHHLEKENKAIRADFQDFQAKVNNNINNELTAKIDSLGSMIKNIEMNIRSEIYMKICEVDKGFGETINALNTQVEKQKVRLSEQILRINELGRVADQVVSKVASLFKRKSDENPEGRDESKRQCT
jgi:chromosome segregation ATPase